MLQYIDFIIVPYVEQVRDTIGEDKAALMIFDNFRGQVTDKVLNLLEQKNILVSLLPANTTDLLQPMDLSVNKPAKDYLKNKFEEWYSHQVAKQLEGKCVNDLEEVELEQKLDLSRIGS